MAYTFEQVPEGQIYHANQPLIVTVYDDTNTGEEKFRYVLDVEINGALVARLKTLPNASDVGIFDISKVVQDYLSIDYTSNSTTYATTTQPIHELHEVASTVELLSQNKDAIKFVELKGRAEWYVTANGAVTLTTVRSSKNFYAIDSAIDYEQGFNVEVDRYVRLIEIDVLGTPTLPFTANDLRVLTNAPLTQYAYADDYGTLAFLNHLYFDAPNFTESNYYIDEVEYKSYNKAGTLLNTVTVDMSTNGTVDGNSTIDQASEAQKVIYIPFGFKNFEESATLNVLSPNVTATVDKVTVEIKNATVDSYYKIYTLQLDPYCSKYKPKRFAFRNRFGAWDYVNFNAKNSENSDINRETYVKPIGNWSGATYALNSFDRTKTSFNTKSVKKGTANTNFISENDVNWLQELFESEDVYVYEGGYWKPIVITDTNFITKTTVNDRLIQYSINYEYSNNKWLN